jgi:hypothetical protein
MAFATAPRRWSLLPLVDVGQGQQGGRCAAQLFFFADMCYIQLRGAV